MARIFAVEGAIKEVTILSEAQAEFIFTHSYEEGYGEWKSQYSLVLTVPSLIYAQIGDVIAFEQRLFIKASELLRPHLHGSDDELSSLSIATNLQAKDNWRDQAKAWSAGKGITNQGRVRSDNIAPKTCDGLLFRSEPEINLYKALKTLGVSFAPLPVFVRGGKTYSRIEPDFVILKDGIVMIVEVDGDTVHTETPADAHARTTMLAHEGAAIERVKASECATEELAKGCAEKLLTALAKLKTSR